MFPTRIVSKNTHKLLQRNSLFSASQSRSVTMPLNWVAEEVKSKSPFSKGSPNRPRKFDYKEMLEEDQQVKGGLKRRLHQREKQRDLLKQEMEYALSDKAFLTIDKVERSTRFRDLEDIQKKPTVPGEISQIEYLQNIVPKFVDEVIEDKGHIYLKTSNRYLPQLQKFLFLHMNTQAKICSDITAVDYLYNKRFQMIYNLKSSTYNQQYFIKFWVGADDYVMSSKQLYPSALWYEREVYDMFGIQFMGERETRRLLNDYGFKGHPLRKDFPLSGFTELFYDSRVEEISYKPVSLVQKYRFYNKPSVWQGKRGAEPATKYTPKAEIEG